MRWMNGEAVTSPNSTTRSCHCHTYLQRHQTDERGKAVRGHEADGGVLVSHAAQHGHDEEDDVGHHAKTQLLQNV